ncbi:hypothetical protein AB0N28_03435 [Streptomyces sp. NPDC051130]|uniref:hypothetical protein n=1 Tax=Streptomyces sp. NPDC051130 TaxID=3157223 RepID=UPI003445304C
MTAGGYRMEDIPYPGTGAGDSLFVAVTLQGRDEGGEDITFSYSTTLTPRPDFTTADLYLFARRAGAASYGFDAEEWPHAVMSFVVLPNDPQGLRSKG